MFRKCAVVIFKFDMEYYKQNYLTISKTGNISDYFGKNTVIMEAGSPEESGAGSCSQYRSEHRLQSLPE